ncbi:MAG: phosphatase PAP2 family protein [Phenylobacterium sp.]|jgi:undecaprenyl-diphosphatase|uniref:phosphatase PAP2 family protein n=1 Tax=Phenylobacterium sp. TaxID=1871053 RepID=UPI001B633F0B|nr:phosphatase PAP2 family protein [Phenylobacterium sp.]MBP7649512.1 phosphatase PAP2 family protein [Phenylobacterium sp.]MBP7816526.1 phosphatase PAP2 family protein [Phenylobacterium sp.]MBP9231209.1 phosphatase PAP2 family protein [Phenylobacterium sp.]MBP9755842.1 phosphatase PAP2 family protein [Phenylobacterium sp.]
MTKPAVPPVLISVARRIETRALLIWLACAGAIWGFFNIAGEVMEGDADIVDQQLLLMLRRPSDLSDPIGPPWVEEALRDITALGGFTFLTIATIVAVLLFSFHGKRRQAWILAGTVLGAQVSSEVLKTFYDRPRPSLVPHGSFVYTQSFPSGHSALAAAVFLTLATLIASVEKRPSSKILIYVLAVVITIGVGFSRVYLGVHWPSDVLAGWSLGATWAFAAWIVLEWMRSRDVSRERG